jgi:hypothetical protein
MNGRKSAGATQAAAVRELLKFGLAAAGIDAGAGVKSSDYGVFSRGAKSDRSASQGTPDEAEGL